MSGDDATGSNTTCDPVLCGADQRVQSNACVPCDAGETNAAGDSAAGGNTACDPILCGTNQRVQSNACVACPPGTTNLSGDDASGTDTMCDATICGADQKVEENACVPCEAGATNAAGDDASMGDTTCDPIMCGADERVEMNACVACPAGETNDPGDLATGGDTSCDSPTPIDYLSSTNTHSDCVAEGGMVVPISGDSSGSEVCRFDLDACPTGWSWADGWSTTSNTDVTWVQPTSSGFSTTCNGVTYMWSTIFGGSGPMSSGSHSWSNNSDIEFDRCYVHESAADLFYGDCSDVGIANTTTRTVESCVSDPGGRAPPPALLDFYDASETTALAGYRRRRTELRATAVRTQTGCY